MRASILKPIILITEGRTDASIICSLINTRDNIVYMVVAGGFHKIASTIRTQYLMYGDEYNYIAAFDSDNDSSTVKQDKLSMIRFLSKADMYTDRIGVFCFRNNIESELGITHEEMQNKNLLIQALQQRGAQMKQSETIKEIQQFVDRLCK